MASIRKRNDRWHVQIRRKGYPALNRSFATKSDAVAWARKVETDVDRRGLPVGLKVLDSLTLADLLNRYMVEVTAKKRGALRETWAIRTVLKHDIAKLALSNLSVALVEQHRDRRLRAIKPSTINRELAIYRHALEVARRSWGIPIPENPFSIVEKPRISDARTRRFREGEWEKLKAACVVSRNPHVAEMIELGLETAMRRGEVLRMRWGHLNEAARTLYIPITKNGYPRTIPLTSRALAILRAKRPLDATAQDVVFPTTEDAVKMAWRRIMRRAKLSDFRYHDLRHEAVSRFFEMGLSMPEVALISGHRDTKMLMRYTHLNPEIVGAKLT